ncbi:MAG: hypothetical protein ACOY3Y_19995 [Acidobacteriota bacterium]
MRSLGSAFALALVLTGCLGAGDTTGVPAQCPGILDGEATDYSPCRAFHGRLQLPTAKELAQLPDAPLQILALGFVPKAGGQADAAPPPSTDGGISTPPPSASAPTAEVTPRFFYGAPFAALEGAGYRPTIPFAVVVPCGISVNLMLQQLRASGDKLPGIQVAQLSFARSESATAQTTLIPRQPADACGGKAGIHDLGVVVLTLAKRGVLSSGAIVLGKGGSKNPLELVGPPEGQASDQDQDGDGILDSAQTFAALPDLATPGVAPGEKPAPDGIPDIFQ